MNKNVTYTPEQVANYFIAKATGQHVPVTHLQLQKLLYFAHGWSLALRDRPLLKVPVQAWPYGPVVDELYHVLKGYGKQPVDAQVKNYLGMVPSIDESSENTEVRNLLDKVWDVYGHRRGSELSNMTHEKETPWRSIYDEYKEAGKSIPRDYIIPNELIKDYFKKKAKSNKDAR